jgi:hypothetical protein
MSKPRVWIRDRTRNDGSSGSALRKHVEWGSAESNQEIDNGSVLDPYWFQCGSGSSFYLNADPETDPDPGSQTNADPDGTESCSDFLLSHKKLNFYMKKYLKSTGR